MTVNFNIAVLCLFLCLFAGFVDGQCKGGTWLFSSFDQQRFRFFKGYEQRVVAQDSKFPYNGNTGATVDCALEFPLACISPDSPVGSIPSDEYYERLKGRMGGKLASHDPGGMWQGNTISREVKLTANKFSGHCFTSLAAMNGFCVNEFGAGYTAAHQHSGRLEPTGAASWGVVVYHEPSFPTPESFRIWTFMPDQTWNPWDNGANVALCTQATSDWHQQRDECVTYGKPVCPDFQTCSDRDPLQPGGIQCGSCTDGKRNPDEWGIDCGGKCVDKPCSSDCAVSCAVDCPPCAASCEDGWQNGNEVAVDCGGPDCAPCLETCWDGILNNNETSVDCGGPMCVPCEGFADFSPSDIPAPHTCFNSTAPDVVPFCPDSSTNATCFLTCSVSTSTGAPTPQPTPVPTLNPTPAPTVPTLHPTPAPTTSAPTATTTTTTGDNGMDQQNADAPIPFVKQTGFVVLCLVVGLCLGLLIVFLLFRILSTRRGRGGRGDGGGAVIEMKDDESSSRQSARHMPRHMTESREMGSTRSSFTENSELDTSGNINNNNNNRPSPTTVTNQYSQFSTPVGTGVYQLAGEGAPSPSADMLPLTGAYQSTAAALSSGSVAPRTGTYQSTTAARQAPVTTGYASTAGMGAAYAELPTSNATVPITQGYASTATVAPPPSNGNQYAWVGTDARASAAAGESAVGANTDPSESQSTPVPAIQYEQLVPDNK